MMKRQALTLLWLCFCLTSICQTYRYKADFSLSKKNFCDTIPIEVEDDQIFVNAVIGDRSYRLNIDTGSSHGMIFSDSPISPLLNLGNILSRDANGQTDSVKVVSLPPFRIGNLVVSNYVASAMSRPAVEHNYDAIIGFDLFNKGLFGKIDTRRKILILTDNKKLFRKEEGHELRYKLKWFVPYVGINPIPGCLDQALFDTGSRQLYTMNKQFFDQQEASGTTAKTLVEGRTKGRNAIGGFGSEEDEEVVFLHLDCIKWNDFAFSDIRTTTTQGSSKLGAQLLNYGSLIINPKRKSLVFQPFEQGDSVVVGNKPTNITFVPLNGRASVGLIYPLCDAYLKGIRSGDVIVQIDDTPILSFNDFRQFRFVKDKEHVLTLIDRDGEKKVIAIELLQE